MGSGARGRGLLSVSAPSACSVTDIYLPRWSAHSLPAIHVPLIPAGRISPLDETCEAADELAARCLPGSATAPLYTHRQSWETCFRNNTCMSTAMATSLLRADTGAAVRTGSVWTVGRDH